MFKVVIFYIFVLTENRLILI